MLAVVRGDFLYIDGGELDQIDSSSGTQTPVINTQNTTLSIDLRSSWTNESVVINSIDKGNAPVLNEEWLWHDPDGKTFYIWGGGNSPLVSRPEPDNTLWAFTADGKGGGKWKSHGQVPSSLIRTSNALVATSTDGIGYAVGGYGPDPVQGIVSYDMAAQTWNNGSTVDISSTGTAVDGQLIYSNVFGEDGILIALDGSDGTTGEVATLNDFSTVKIYDRKSAQWLEQATTGSPPAKRITFCAVGVHGKSSMEIYLMGGFGGFDPLTAYDDVYVLSLPSFTWYKADYAPDTGRTLHTCHAVGRQMIVIGGTSNDDSWQTGDSITGTYRDPWPWGLGVFDMSKMQWAGEFDADAANYVTPDVVLAGIAANGSQPKTWTSSEIKQVFSHTTLSQASSSNSSSSSGSSPSGSSSSGITGGAIAGIVIGVVALIFIVLFTLWLLRRSKRKSRAQHNPYPEENGAYPMDYHQAGKHSPTARAPLIEVYGDPRPEKNPYPDRGPGNHRNPAELDQGPNFVAGRQAHEKMGRSDEDQWRHELP